jgi:hypothetical protein
MVLLEWRYTLVPLTCLVAIDIQIDDFIEFFGRVEDTEVVLDVLVKQVPLRLGNTRGRGLVLCVNIRMRRSLIQLRVTFGGCGVCFWM